MSRVGCRRSAPRRPSPHARTKKKAGRFRSHLDDDGVLPVGKGALLDRRVEMVPPPVCILGGVDGMRGRGRGAGDGAGDGVE